MTKTDSAGNSSHEWKPYISNSLRCWFVGYNPGMMSYREHCYYAHPTNRFWQLLHEAGFSNQLLTPPEYRRVRELGLGLIDLVMRPTVSGSELRKHEILAGRDFIAAAAMRLHPKWIAANGLQIARILTGNRHLNEYGECGVLVGTAIPVWALPSSSGRAASHHGKPMTYEQKLCEWKKLHDKLKHS